MRGKIWNAILGFHSVIVIAAMRNLDVIVFRSRLYVSCKTALTPTVFPCCNDNNRITPDFCIIILKGIRNYTSRSRASFFSTRNIVDFYVFVCDRSLFSPFIVVTWILNFWNVPGKKENRPKSLQKKAVSWCDVKNLIPLPVSGMLGFIGREWKISALQNLFWRRF